MTTRYVQRKAGQIVASFARPQPGIAEEGLKDDNPELRTFEDASRDVPDPGPAIESKRR